MTDENTIDEVDSKEALTMTLTDVFKDPDPDESEQPEYVAEEEPEEELEGEAEESTDEPEAETPSAEEEGGISVPLTALKDERQKRQLAEEELTNAKQQLAKFQQKAGDVPDPESDPEGYKAFFEDKANADRITERIAVSTEIVKDTKEDYDDMEALFLQMASKDNTLAARMTASKNPALFAYQTAKAQSDKIEAEKVTEREALKASIREELMKEMGIEPEPSKEEKRNKSAISVPNLTRATAKGKNSTPKQIFKHDSDALFKNSPFG